jgi:hypothetical protein
MAEDITFNQKLFDARQTDADRWRNAESTYGAKNPLRAQIASCLIPEGRSVLDIGAASQILRRYLYEGCKYVPSDYLDRGNGTLVCDLNKGEFPEGRYDYVVTLGVVEYVHDVDWMFSRIYGVGKYYILTYNVIRDEDEGDAILIQRVNRYGWRNAFSRAELVRKLESAGWKVKKEVDGGGVNIGGLMILCEKQRKVRHERYRQKHRG